MKITLNLKDQSVPKILKEIDSRLNRCKPDDMKEYYYQEGLKKEIDKYITLGQIAELVKQIN